MYTSDGINISVPRGDTADIKIIFRDSSGNPYTIPEGSTARLSVYMVDDTKAVIVKNAGPTDQDADGAVIYSFTAKDTGILRGDYCYNVKIIGISQTDTVLGFGEPAFFAIGTNAIGTEAADIIITIK